jgi:hypothetical protein
MQEAIQYFFIFPSFSLHKEAANKPVTCLQFLFARAREKAAERCSAAALYSLKSGSRIESSWKIQSATL